MSLVVQLNNRTETIKLDTISDDYSCAFEEICEVIRKQFDLDNLLSEYHIVYYDPSCSTWINFNIHVSNRVTELLRYSLSNSLQIRLKYEPRKIHKPLIKRETPEQSNSQTINHPKYAHLIVWLDEDIGNPLLHRQLKRIFHAMLNTNTNTNTFEYDDIDTKIQFNMTEWNIEPNLRSSFRLLSDIIHNDWNPFNCALFIFDNTDEFLNILRVNLLLAQSLSVIISGSYAIQTLPILISHKQKQLLPPLSFFYVFCSNIQYYYNWALGYVENDKLNIDTNLELFDDERAMFVRLLNDICQHLSYEGDRCQRQRMEYWKALQYYRAARQLLLNTFLWDNCPTLSELNRLNQFIGEMSEAVVKKSSETLQSWKSDDDNNTADELELKWGEQCIETH